MVEYPITLWVTRHTSPLIIQSLANMSAEPCNQGVYVPGKWMLQGNECGKGMISRGKNDNENPTKINMKGCQWTSQGIKCPRALPGERKLWTYPLPGFNIILVRWFCCWRHFAHAISFTASPRAALYFCNTGRPCHARAQIVKRIDKVFRYVLLWHMQ